MPEKTYGATEQKVLLLINETIGFIPPLALTNLERAHRIGPAKDKEGRPRKRPTIVRFRSERLRYSVFRSRSNLNEYSQGHPDNDFHERRSDRAPCVTHFQNTTTVEPRFTFTSLYQAPILCGHPGSVPNDFP